MTKEIHFLLNSLNDYLHCIDGNNDEVLYWRKRFLDENVIDEKKQQYFLSIPSSAFMKKLPEEHISEIEKYFSE